MALISMNLHIPKWCHNSKSIIVFLYIIYCTIIYRLYLNTAFPVTYVAKSIWSFFCMTLRPLDLRYSTRFPFPMNSVTSLIVSPRTTPINWTRLGCRNDLQHNFFFLNSIKQKLMCGIHIWQDQCKKFFKNIPNFFFTYKYRIFMNR